MTGSNVGSTVRVTVGGIAHGGHCVARHDGRVIFVRHALPGEVVDVRLTESGDDASFWRGDAVAILEPSPDRVESAWPEAGAGGVGGAELAHVRLDAQRDWKLTVLREAFERFAKQEYTGTINAAPGDDERGGLRWRTRITAVADAEGRPAMHLHRSKRTKALTAMPLADESAEAALLSQRFPGGSAIMVVAPSGTPGEARVLVDGLPWRGGRTDKRTNAPAHVREVVEVDGEEFEYRVATGGFWQVHRSSPAVLVSEVLKRVGDSGSVLELYSGAGLLTLPLAASGRDVTSIESDDAAAANARRNLHEFKNATVVQGDVRRQVLSGVGRTDTVVLDPPRSGAGKATLDAIVGTDAKKLVYVACDPVALARDVALLAARGYDLVDATAWDLFPMTHHVETVATFVKR